MVHVDEIGVTFRLYLLSGGLPMDLTGADVTLLFLRPGGSVATEHAATVTDVAGGVVEWLSEAPVLDRPGRWSWQARIEVGASVFYSVTRFFDVARHL